jgi:hypothetical protein
MADVVDPGDLQVVQGATYTFRATLNDDADPPVPQSLAGLRAHMQIRRKAKASSPVLIDLRSDGTNPAITIEPDGETGVVLVRIPASETAKLVKQSVYDLFVIDITDSTEAMQLVGGDVFVTPSVTIESP